MDDCCFWFFDIRTEEFVLFEPIRQYDITTCNFYFQQVARLCLRKQWFHRPAIQRTYKVLSEDSHTSWQDIVLHIESSSLPYPHVKYERHNARIPVPADKTGVHLRTWHSELLFPETPKPSSPLKEAADDPHE